MSDEKALTVASLGDTVRDKVRLAMLNAIPDDAMDKLIAGEFANFFEDTKKNYSNDDSRSPFKRMVAAEINKSMQETICNKIQSCVAAYVDGKGNDVTKEIVTMITPVVFESLMGSVANQVVNTLRQQINNGRVY